MPPAKKIARKTTKKTARKPAKRTMSAAHKKALAEGRSMSATVDAYLASINVPKRRGRKVSKAALQHRLDQAQARAKSSTGVDKVLASQEIRDLGAKLTQASAGSSAVDTKKLEAKFVAVAKTFSENRGIRWSAWRDAGVPGAVLTKAGIARTRG